MKEDIRINMGVEGVEKSTSQVKTFQTTLNRSLTDSEKKVASSMKSMVGSFISIAAGVTAVKKAVGTGVEFNKFMESSTTAFAVMMKSVDSAKAKMKELYDYSVTNPLTFKETVAASRQLMAYGFGADELTKSLDLLGTVSKATGVQLGDLTYVYGTLKAQGRAYSRDLMQFGMRGIPIYEELGKVMGVPAKQIQKMASDGAIGFKQVEQAFKNMTSSGGRYAGMLEQYMGTLEGKLDIFTNLFEKGLGDVMKGLTDEFKNFVVSMTEAIGSPKFERFIQQLSEDIGKVAKTFFDLATILIDMLPFLYGFLKVWIAFKALNIAGSVLSKLPLLLMNIANGVLGITYQMGILNMAQWGANIQGAFMYAVAGIKALSASLQALIVANPWLLAIAGIAGITVAIGKATEAAADARRNSPLESDRKQQLIGDKLTSAFTKPEDVAKIAEEYKLSLATTVQLLINIRSLNEAEWRNYLNTKATNLALEERKKILDAMANSDKRTKEQREADYFAEVTGKGDREAYMDYTNGPNNDHAKGRKAANAFIEGYANIFNKEKDKFREVFTPDMQADLLQKEAEGLKEQLSAFYEAFGTESVEETGFGPAIRERLAQIKILTDGLKEAEKDLKEKMSWTAREWAVKVTETRIDDIDLEKDKAIYAVEEEYKERMATAKKLGKDTLGLQTELEATLANVRKFYIDETEKYKREQALKTYQKMAEGDSEFFNDLRVKASQGDQGANAATGLEGTDVGKLMAGGDPLTMLIKAAVDFALSIENVMKSLNFFGTFFEAMRPLLEPLINTVLDPFVDLMEQMGEGVSAILLVLGPIYKIMISLWYMGFMPLLAALQVLGGVFTWFYDEVMVPVGNAMIDIMNGVIAALNEIPFVNIRYISRLEKSLEMIAGALDNKDILDAMKHAVDRLNEFIDKDIKSLQDLYDVGAITGAEYDAQWMELDNQRISLEENMLKTQVDQLATMEELNKWIQDNWGAYLKALDEEKKQAAKTGHTNAPGNNENESAGANASELERLNAEGWRVRNELDEEKRKPFWKQDIGKIMDREGKLAALRAQVIAKGSWPSFKVGTDAIPNDMLAQVHKDEGIIPASFMDAIRSGKLTLSGGQNKGGGQNTTIYVTVEGSVIRENDLAESIANRIYTRRSRNIITT